MPESEENGYFMKYYRVLQMKAMYCSAILFFAFRTLNWERGRVKIHTSHEVIEGYNGLPHEELELHP